jgi:hypothetical protein
VLKAAHYDIKKVSRVIQSIESIMSEKSPHILHSHAKISAKHRPEAKNIGGEFPCCTGPKVDRLRVLAARSFLGKMSYYFMVDSPRVRSSNQFWTWRREYAEPEVFLWADVTSGYGT